MPTAELTAPHRGGSTIRRSLTSSNAAKTGHGLSRSQRRTIRNQRALAIAETAYGPEHPDVGAALNTLALIVGELGDFAAARPLAERPWPSPKPLTGPSTPMSAPPSEQRPMGYCRDRQQTGAPPAFQAATIPRRPARTNAR